MSSKLIQILDAQGVLKDVPEENLEKTEGPGFVEYRFPGDPLVVHRSVTTALEPLPAMTGTSSL